VLKKIFAWADGLPPLLNLLVTAGFHGLLVFVAGFAGLHWHMVVGYAMKEIDPLTRRGFDPLYWNGWRIADSIADFVFPVVAAVVHTFVL
jgi:hypothetical protein